MKRIEIISLFTEYDNFEELDKDDQRLVSEAKASMNDAYAPYSHFQVGAALLLDNGVIVKGNNQENASYPVGLCAERVAIFSAGANYPGIGIKALAVSARSDNFQVDKPVPPCGACRQAISEYEHRYKKKIRMLMSGESGKVITSDAIENLLPFQFNADDLKTKIK
jgi:cytidine deaminase